jgi:hypothetical protein
VADTKVSALASATLPLDGTELLPVVQGGVSKKVAVSGVAGAWTEILLDFDSWQVGDGGDHTFCSPRTEYGMSVTVTDAAVLSTSKIIVVPSGKLPTGRGTVGDDWLWDGLILSGFPAAIGGSFTLMALAVPGPIRGLRYVLYQIG